MTPALRWFAVLPAALAGWFLALALGLAAHSLGFAFCPADEIVSGACVAPWFGTFESTLQIVFAGLAGALVVFLAAAAAPRNRSIVAWCALAAGACVAVYFAVRTAAIAEFFAAVASGLTVVILFVKLGKSAA